MLIGSHVSLSGADQYLSSVKEALKYGANALMVYTGAPQNTLRKPTAAMKIPAAWSLMAENDIDRINTIVHAPYIVNLANPDREKRDHAVAFLISEVERTSDLGSPVLVLHPGSHLGGGLQSGIELVSEGLNRILQSTQATKVTIALENMAGKGNEIGASFAELESIVKLINDKSRVALCLDTCHSHDSGSNLDSGFDELLKEIDMRFGLDKLKVVHLNDSKNPRNTHKDRHENIGFGAIGFDTLCKIACHPLLAGIPKILETPYVKSSTYQGRSYPPYRQEIMMLRSKKFDPMLIRHVLEEYEGDDAA